jgi:hypothetical protein
MRLTLRTLLAYLNQSNLNLRAVERIEAKVKSSPAAGKLIEELRRIIADPHLAAPPPDNDEPFNDANSVAEYLDNSLDEAKVESFEKRAFESKLLLGEIVGCHEILSAICRNEKVVASAALRQRAYEIGRVPLDQIASAETVEIDYLGSGTRVEGVKETDSHQFLSELSQPEAEFQLGPPPEESHRHDEWADNLSEELEELHRKKQLAWPLALLGGAIALLAIAVWLFIRARFAP